MITKAAAITNRGGLFFEFDKAVFKLSKLYFIAFSLVLNVNGRLI